MTGTETITAMFATRHTLLALTVVCLLLAAALAVAFVPSLGSGASIAASALTPPRH